MRSKEGTPMRKTNKFITTFILIISFLIVLVAGISACKTDESISDSNPEPEINATEINDSTAQSALEFPTITASAKDGPFDVERIERYVLQYMQFVTDGIITESSDFRLMDGVVTDHHITVAGRVFEYYSKYDTSNVSVINIDYDSSVPQYTVLLRDGNSAEFTIHLIYGDSLIGINVSMFE
jgi:hypothetical protein